MKETISETRKVKEDKLGTWEANQLEVKSEVNIEDDTGTGHAVIIRNFTFGVNPLEFKRHPPTLQELFNHHLKQIEIMLWKDGMKIMTEVEPKIVFNKDNTKYTIIVGAIASRGNLLTQQPQRMQDILNASR